LVGESEVEEVARICRRRWEMPPTELMDWDDLELLVARGHELGGHTMAHPYMHRLRFNDAELEIGSCRAVLLQRFGIADHFAWPYGGFRHMRPEIASAVFAGGFTSCASGQRGAHAIAPTPDHATRPVCIRRDSLVAAWPLRHTQYFLANSAANLLAPADTWPHDWTVTKELQRAA
jgi:peptidoglycan/xylan/chitin deacetylase (PgdA/CDA1 family)